MWRTVGIGAFLLIIGTSGCAGSGGDNGSISTTSASERSNTEALPPSTTTSSTTTMATTTTTISVQERYRAIDAEIQRACNAAMDSGQPAMPVFNDAWGDISSPQKLAATVKRCVDGRIAARQPATTVAPTQPLVPQTTAPVASSTYYENCDAVRAAGAAPLYRGEPGYASHLDRDDDGIACET